MTEAEILKQAQNGNAWAMNQLFKMNYGILKGYLFKLTLNQELAEDLSQETMVKAIRNFKKYQPKGKFSTWLVAIGKNCYIDYLRKNKLEESSKVHTDASDPGTNTEIEALQRLEMNAMKKALGVLSDEKRNVFILKHYYGYSYQEIAEIEGCPLGTVRSRLHHSIIELQGLLRKEGFHE